MHSYTIISVFTSFLILFSLVSGEEATLELVHVIFRHGDRTPVDYEEYPTDPHMANKFYPTGFGQLTNQGKLKAYNLGKLLHQRYGSFLGKLYTPDLIKAFSTDFDRTKMSLQLVLAGLFPPDQSQIWNDAWNWIPIPYQYEKHNEDYLLIRPIYYCPSYAKELRKIQDIELPIIMNSSSILAKNISVNAKKQMKNFIDLFYLYQTLYAEEQLNLTLPSWTRTIYPKPLSDIAIKKLSIESSTTNLKRLNGGRMLAKILENMKLKLNKPSILKGRKLFLYSGHEANVFSLLSVFNILPPHFPDFCSSIAFELHRIREKYFIKILYLRNVKSGFMELYLKNCDVFCPMEKFKEIFTPYLPNNYTAECDSNKFLN